MNDMDHSEKHMEPVKWIMVSYLEGSQTGGRFLVNVAEYSSSPSPINISKHDPDTKSSSVVMEILKMEHYRVRNESC